MDVAGHGKNGKTMKKTGKAQQLAADTHAVCPSPPTPCACAVEAEDLNRQARSRAFQANVAYGVAGGAAVAAAVLWLTGAPESRVAITPHPRRRHRARSGREF